MRFALKLRISSLVTWTHSVETDSIIWNMDCILFTFHALEEVSSSFVYSLLLSWLMVLCTIDHLCDCWINFITTFTLWALLLTHHHGIDSTTEFTYPVVFIQFWETICLIIRLVFGWQIAYLQLFSADWTFVVLVWFNPLFNANFAVNYFVILAPTLSHSWLLWFLKANHAFIFLLILFFLFLLWFLFRFCLFRFWFLFRFLPLSFWPHFELALKDFLFHF